MENKGQTYEMKGGRVLTDADLETLAEEAERGYDPAQFARSPGRPGRPRMGAAPAVVLPFGCIPILKQRSNAERRLSALRSVS
jgi:hypothetical protein